MVSIGDTAICAADAPVHVHVAPDYISGSAEKIGVPNVVTQCWQAIAAMTRWAKRWLFSPRPSPFC